MKRVLITGITGYIGSNLACDLLSDYEVYGLVREPVNMEYIADIAPQIHLVPCDGTYRSMAAALHKSQPDVVYHLAAYYTGAHGAEATPALISSNITLGAYLLEAMACCGVKSLVCAATIMSHYKGEAYRPLNLYAATKQAFSDLLRYYTDANLLRAVTLVISDTYGPGDHRPKILNLVKKAAQTGEKMQLSAGMQSYDVLFIDDVVSAFRMVGEQLLEGRYQDEVFQIVPEEPVSLRETVEKMVRINHLDLDAVWGGRPPAEREMTELVRLYPAPPGWRPQVSLEDGLRMI